MRHGSSCAPLLLAIAEGRTAELKIKVVEHFIQVHDRHISLENARLLPQAERLLNRIQLEALSRSMATRRGVVFPNTCNHPQVKWSDPRR